MEHRDKVVKDFRPILDIQNNSEEDSAELMFQNQVLRPLLKFQNDILVAVFQQHAVRSKIELSKFNKVTLQHYIKSTLSKDLQLRNLIIGLIVAFFTEEECHYYLGEQKNIGKRIISMTTERLYSSL